MSTVVPAAPSFQAKAPYIASLVPYPPTLAYTGQAMVANAPTPATRPASGPSCSSSVRLGPMAWSRDNFRDEVGALFTLVPELNVVNKLAIQINSTNNPQFVKNLFATASDATAFARVWNASKPLQYAN